MVGIEVGRDDSPAGRQDTARGCPIQNWPAEKVAEDPTFSRNAVLLAKRGVLARMREIQNGLEDL